jgi:hypothetical protein
MGLQDIIDNQIGDDIHSTTSIHLEGKSGSATVPAGISIRLYDCQLDDITFEEGCTVHVRGGRIQHLTIKKDCQFLIDEQEYIEKIDIEGSRGFIKGKVEVTEPGAEPTRTKIEVKDMVNITDHAKVEFHDILFTYELKVADVTDSFVKFFRCNATVSRSGVFGITSTIEISDCEFPY